MQKRKVCRLSPRLDRVGELNARKHLLLLVPPPGALAKLIAYASGPRVSTRSVFSVP